jgi:LacI family transcriptional regulator
MANQRGIAAAAGVSQATVSLVMRNDPSIPEATRAKVLAVAESIGYRPNAYVSSLMAQIRSGRGPSDSGCIAVLVDEVSEQDWLESGETLVRYYHGMARRAEALGFRTELFFLQDPEINSKQLDRILCTRGIKGIIFSPPRQRITGGLDLSWAEYACATISYDLSVIQMDRVSTHHRHNVEKGFSALCEHGYSRIGMCLPPEALDGVDYGWRERFLLLMDRKPPSERIPLFVGKPGKTPMDAFKAWLDEWKPDAMLCLIGHELEWLSAMGISVPDDLGLVCVNRPLDSTYSGIEEGHELIGATVVELVAAKIIQNDFGVPAVEKLILIEGKWVDGETIRRVN